MLAVAIALVIGSGIVPPGSDLPAGAPDSARVVLPTPESVPSVAPSPTRLARMRRLIGRGRFRIQVGPDRYELEPTLIDSAGIAFDSAALEPMSKWSSGEKLPPPPLASPISWERVDRIHVHSNAVAGGAVLGGILAPLALAGLVKITDQEGESGDWGILYLVSVPVGLLAGAATGALRGRWQILWDRGWVASEPAAR